jgi:hypothetical protein
MNRTALVALAFPRPERSRGGTVISGLGPPLRCLARDDMAVSKGD